MYLGYIKQKLFSQKVASSELIYCCRYIICKSMRADSDPVREYMHEINLELLDLLRPMSKDDVTEIVPMTYLQNNEAFFEYMCVSNDR